MYLVEKKHKTIMEPGYLLDQRYPVHTPATFSRWYLDNLLLLYDGKEELYIMATDDIESFLPFCRTNFSAKR